MAERDRATDEWEEVIGGIRGSCGWGGNVVRTLHLCELVVLDGVEELPAYGLDQQSRYLRPASACGKRPTVFLQRELLVEEQNSGCNSTAKIIAIAGVLAHEMAHHALRQAWQVEERYSDVTVLNREKRQWVLDMIEAGKLAKLAGVPYDVIVGHWAIADDDMHESVLETAAEESDQRVLDPESSRAAEHENFEKQVGLHVAEEWCAAVVGCLMSYRFRKGYDYAKTITQSVMDDLGSAGTSNLVHRALLAACQNPTAEARATELAIGSLETAFHNPHLEECGRKLNERGLTWRVMFDG